MANDAEQQIIRLLTELRDAQREELAYRRRTLDESIVLQRRAMLNQRIGMGLLFAGLLFAVGWLVIDSMSSK